MTIEACKSNGPGAQGKKNNPMFIRDQTERFTVGQYMIRKELVRITVVSVLSIFRRLSNDKTIVITYQTNCTVHGINISYNIISKMLHGYVETQKKGVSQIVAASKHQCALTGGNQLNRGTLHVPRFHWHHFSCTKV